MDEQEQVSSMFNAISKGYDRVNRCLSLGIDQRWRKTLARHLPEKKNLKLLDLATGTCDQLILLMQTGKIASGMGIDLADEMLAIGKKKISKLSFAKKIELMHASASKLPFPDQSFDCASITFGIRNVQGNCLKEMYRVLAPEGRALILEFSLPKNRLVRFFHLLYLRNVLPIIGGIMTKEKGAYRYLNQTIEAYPYGERFLSMMKREGFSNCRAIPLTFGVATLYVGERP